MSEVADIIMGQSPASIDCNADCRGFPLLNGPTEFGSHHPTPVQYTTDARRIAQRGDLLFCVRGSTTGRMNWADRRYAIGRGLAAIRSKNGKSTNHFVKAAIEYKLDDLLAAATGSTFPNLSRDQLNGIFIPLPPLPVQRRIAKILGDLDDKIELNRKMNETLEHMARALFKSWFIDFDPVRAKMDGRMPEGMDADTAALFPSRLVESELGLVPEGWEVGRLGDIVGCFDSKRIPLSGRQREAMPGLYPYYGAASIMDYVDDYIFEGVYLLIGEDGSVINEDGTPVTQYAWGKFWVNNHAHVLQGKNGICTEHVMLALKGMNIAAFVTGAVQPKLNQGNMNRIPLVIPPLLVGDAFAETIAPVFTKIRENINQSRTLASLRDTLLPKLMRGEVLGVRGHK
jgi:type I restriction enzyme S subunit